jgi:hypothetical protein
VAGGFHGPRQGQLGVEVAVLGAAAEEDPHTTPRAVGKEAGRFACRRVSLSVGIVLAPVHRARVLATRPGVGARQM